MGSVEVQEAPRLPTFQRGYIECEVMRKFWKEDFGDVSVMISKKKITICYKLEL